MSNSYRHGYSKAGAGEGRWGRKRQRRTAESGDFWKHFYVRKHKLYSHIWFIYIVKYIYIYSCIFHDLAAAAGATFRCADASGSVFNFTKCRRSSSNRCWRQQVSNWVEGTEEEGRGIAARQGGLGMVAIGNRQRGKRRRIWLFFV